MPEKSSRLLLISLASLPCCSTLAPVAAGLAGGSNPMNPPHSNPSSLPPSPNVSKPYPPPSLEIPNLNPNLPQSNPSIPLLSSCSAKDMCEALSAGSTPRSDLNPSSSPSPLLDSKSPNPDVEAPVALGLNSQYPASGAPSSTGLEPSNPTLGTISSLDSENPPSVALIPPDLNLLNHQSFPPLPSSKSQSGLEKNSASPAPSLPST